MEDQPISLGRIARSLRERLEVDRLAGWDPPLSRRRLEARPRTPGPASPAPAASPGAAGDGAAERAARESALAPLRAEVAACTRCVLCQSRTQTVFGVGDPAARLMFVGEAPGFDEDREGEPFVGQAGQLLNDIIRAMGLRREEVYIANVVKCRPPQNRAPDASESGACRDYLDHQIEIVRPEIIVALGAVATRALLDTAEGITRLRGKFRAYRGIPLLPTFHPAYLLRNPRDKRLVWEDVQQVMARLGLERPRPA
jgi:DNA polymerase